MTTLSIARDFTPTPGGRFREHGRFSGQEFLEDCLEPAWQRSIQARERLIVLLDGVLGLPASFLEEAFGGLVRKHRNIDLSQVQIDAKDPTLLTYVDLANRFMREAKKH